MDNDKQNRDSIGSWQTAEPGNDLCTGDLIGEYRIEEALGRGGMGEVWKAYSPTEERHVAIKFVPPLLASHPLEMRRVKETFQRIHGLQHQHICPVYSLGEDPRFGFFVVMKCLQGINLAEFRERYARQHGSFPVAEVVHVLHPVASALDYAHAEQVVHRDIKPANIMLNTDGEKVQVVDFGLAAEIRSSITRVSQVRMDSSGTYPYMAPEQWRGQYQDAATDQYALGVVAYELLAGRLPFEAPDDFVLRQCVLQESVPSIDGQSPATMIEIRKALAKERSERFDNCVEFVAALSKTTQQNADAQAPSRHQSIPAGTVRSSSQVSKPDKQAAIVNATLVDATAHALETSQTKSAHSRSSLSAGISPLVLGTVSLLLFLLDRLIWYALSDKTFYFDPPGFIWDVVSQGAIFIAMVAVGLGVYRCIFCGRKILAVIGSALGTPAFYLIFEFFRQGA